MLQRLNRWLGLARLRAAIDQLQAEVAACQQALAQLRCLAMRFTVVLERITREAETQLPAPFLAPVRPKRRRT